MHPIGNFAAYDRSPELQVGNLSTISSADGIFIHHVLLQGKDRHLLGSAMVRHTVPPRIYYIHFLLICQESISNFQGLLVYPSCLSCPRRSRPDGAHERKQRCCCGRVAATAAPLL